MPQAAGSPRRSGLALLPILIGAAFVVVILAAGGFAFAATQETHDSFCASCHTQPESAFYQNSRATQPVDLASFHTTHNTLCINCHSGAGVFGRAQAELLGARNAFKWYSGTAVQPAVLNYPIGDQNCLKCHQNVTANRFAPQEQITVPYAAQGGREREGRPNHWHAFLARWQSAAPSAGGCVSCHAGHAQGTTAQTGFMQAQMVQDTCNACHQDLRRGED